MAMKRNPGALRADPSGPRTAPVRLLKDRISELQHVESGGIVIVTNHGRAVADLVPHRDETTALRCRSATRAWGSVRLPRSGKGRTDSLALLLDERRRR